MTRLTTAGIRREYGPSCAPASQLVTLSMHGEGRITVRDVCADAFRALNAVLVAHDYRTRRADTGAMNCRKITGGSGLSPHAFGVAADLNWTTNPYGSRLVTDMPAAMVRDGLAIRTYSGELVFRWGGNYSTNKDAMHWETLCSLADLRTGIDPATVPGGYRPPASSTPDGQGRPGSFRLGDSGAGVAFLQAMLSIVTPLGHLGNLAPLAADGKYGPATHARVVEFQRFSRAMQQLAGETNEARLLHVDGIAGPATFGALSYWVRAALAH